MQVAANDAYEAVVGPVDPVAVIVTCATTAGWILVVGQVTAVVTGRSVTCEIAPMTGQTKLA